MLRRSHALFFLGAALVAAVAFFACSGDPAPDGAECEANGDCNSGICQGGACAGRPCSCTGESCAKDQCDQGWVCSSRGAVPGLSCTRTCSASNACPGGNRCSDGLCVSGTELNVAWVTRPGVNRCPLGAGCRYAVSASGEGTSDITTWSWTFGDAGVQGDAEIEFRYPTAGTFPVTVSPLLSNGKSGPTLEAVERVCVTDPEAECTPGGDDCCVGTCTVAKRCR